MNSILKALRNEPKENWFVMGSAKINGTRIAYIGNKKGFPFFRTNKDFLSPIELEPIIKYNLSTKNIHLVPARYYVNSAQLQGFFVGHVRRINKEYEMLYKTEPNYPKLGDHYRIDNRHVMLLDNLQLVKHRKLLNGEIKYFIRIPQEDVDEMRKTVDFTQEYPYIVDNSTLEQAKVLKVFSTSVEVELEDGQSQTIRNAFFPTKIFL